ncbi:hypothetical protein [Chamaesiphon minutus]|uniref:hypothetical protein n=1 Tax=Chamaesiphon minutus TaxID=1173032 RepID=UPI0005A05608|nr:hypothetical protein [Chamaesiphon minutus]
MKPVVGAIHELPLPQVFVIVSIAYHTCIQQSYSVSEADLASLAGVSNPMAPFNFEKAYIACLLDSKFLIESPLDNKFLAISVAVFKSKGIIFAEALAGELSSKETVIRTTIRNDDIS